MKPKSYPPRAYTVAELVEATNERLLDALDQQRRYICRVLGADPPCPACGTRQSWFKAHRVDITTATYAEVERIGTDTPTPCRNCGKKIHHVLPFFGGGWYWIIVKDDEGD